MVKEDNNMEEENKRKPKMAELLLHKGCNFCKNRKTLALGNNIECFIPTKGIIMISDHTRKREYLYSAAFCPICGEHIATG